MEKLQQIIGNETDLMDIHCILDDNGYKYDYDHLDCGWTIEVYDIAVIVCIKDKLHYLAID